MPVRYRPRLLRVLSEVVVMRWIICGWGGGKFCLTGSALTGIISYIVVSIIRFGTEAVLTVIIGQLALLKIRTNSRAGFFLSSLCCRSWFFFNILLVFLLDRGAYRVKIVCK